MQLGEQRAEGEGPVLDHRRAALRCRIPGYQDTKL